MMSANTPILLTRFMNEMPPELTGGIFFCKGISSEIQHAQ